ncbi:MAG: ketopantoate reductase family protein [Acidimicrobiales bacterium]|nr:ketopantoate reductase family protein [Acidimicrobiales bacterium]
MHVVVLGAGGLGCAIGARLATSGVEVTLVARERHVDAIGRDGLVVTGLHGNYVVTQNLRAVADPAHVDRDIDYLILAAKCRDTDAALAAAKPLRGRVATALSVQNSVTKDARLAAWIGDAAVIGATTTEAATMIGDGRVHHVGTAPTALYVGELGGGSSERTTALVAACTAGGIGAAVADDITHAEWEKLLQISIVSGFSASALGLHPWATFAEGIAVRAGAEHYATLAHELLDVYLALGYEPRDYFAPYSRFRALRDASWEATVEDTLELGRSMVEAGVLGRPSLHEDLLHGRPTEVDESLGTFIRFADELGVAVPTARGCLRVIRLLEALGADPPKTARPGDATT